MAYTHDLLEEDQDDTLMMAPDRGGAEFGDEGSGATSGYGDLTEDDLAEDDDIGDDVLETDPDDDLMGDDLDDDDDI
ncbi:adhesin [Fibrella aquatilis]|uniref:Adhesin n=1 Tax=Fibrella aquatilis TaxID=2817059 RepID=A0A939G5I2_9BACT|nr:adhesin [Fibrella aquatilis]MBO0930168.1 adhesin [Fibrella aquatilis]